MDHIILSEEWISYDMVFGEKCVHQTCIHINKEISFIFFGYTPNKVWPGGTQSLLLPVS